MARWMWTCFAVASSLALGFFSGGMAKRSAQAQAELPDQTQPPPAITTGAPPASSGTDAIPLRDAAVLKLVDAGWDRNAARTVVGFHWDWLTDLFEVDREAYDRTLIRLAQMPDLGEFWEVLREHPEFAGLLRLVSDPVALARELRNGDRDVLASLFLTRLDSTEAEELASALPGNSALIADLYRRGLVGAEALFIFRRDRPGSREYESWLRATLREAMTRPDDQLAGVFMLLLEEGGAIRERMAKDEQFCLRFPGLWEKLVRVVKKREDDYALYIDQPGLWEFLSEPEAEQLIVDWGLLPVDLLHGEKRYPPEFHARIKELLKKGDEPIADMLLLCRGEPAFHPFLKHDLPLDVLRALSEDLFQRKDRLRARLQVLQEKLAASPDQLREAIGVKSAGAKEYLPFYSVYKVYQNYADGEDSSTLDLAFAAADLASVAVPVAKGLTVFKGGAKVAAKDTVKDLIKNEVATVLKGKARKEVAARFGAVAVNKYSVRLAAKQFLVEAVRAIQKALTRGKVEVSVNVTGFVRFVNQRIGRDPFRRLFGLDPQILLASDGRVYLKLVWSKAVIEKRQRVLWAVRKFVDRLNNDHPGHPEPSPGHTAGRREGAPKGEPPQAQPKLPASKTQAGVLWLMALADILPEGP